MTSKDELVNELIGAEVLGINGGIYAYLGELHLRLTNGKIVRVTAMYDEGLHISELKDE